MVLRVAFSFVTRSQGKAKLMMFSRYIRACAHLITFVLLVVEMPASICAQDTLASEGIVSRSTTTRSGAATGSDIKAAITAVPFGGSASLYADPVQGVSSNDLVQRALASNAELAAVRLDIERARARLRQAGLRPNPTVDFEQTTGRFTNSPGERETIIGFALPLELGGKRQRRTDLARVELEAAEAEVADRERRLANEVRATYAEALAAIRELQITQELNNLDIQTARIVEVRVTEGEAAPLEQNLLRVEIDRLRARGALVEGRLQAALLTLKSITGTPMGEPLRLREELAAPLFAPPPDSVEAAVDIALRARPDLKLAHLNEEAARAGLRLARAQGTPDLTAFSKYTTNSAIFDDTPIGVLRDKDRLLSFGVAISIPVFNRNQGAKAEAELAISQAQRRREFVEQLVRAQVQSAYKRYEAARSAIATYEQGVLERSNRNITAVRGAYEVGAFRVTELLSEQRRFVDSQREFIEALAEQYRALSDLQAAIGAPVNPAQK
jgi:outer membrane protein, heavy metal efflux system